MSDIKELKEMLVARTKEVDMWIKRYDTSIEKQRVMFAEREAVIMQRVRKAYDRLNDIDGMYAWDITDDFK